MPLDGPAGPYSIGSEHWPGLSKLIEECGEVLQVAGKLIGSNGDPMHWDGTNLIERLEDEMADAWGAIVFFVRQNNLDLAKIRKRSVEKQALFEMWQEEQL